MDNIQSVALYWIIVMTSSLLSAFSGAGDLYASALDYCYGGFSVIPCRLDKRPAIKWEQYQERSAGYKIIREWFFSYDAPLHHSIGLVLGKVSQNIVAIDLDGMAAMRLFYGKFPHMSGKTLTVLSGSGNGCHLYFQCDVIPKNMNVRVDGIGGFEIRGNGQYVIAPPSPHPSGNVYKTVALRPIAKVANLDDVIEWFGSMRTNHDKQIRRDIAAKAKPVNLDLDHYKKHYLETVISQEIARVETSNKGNRNKSLFDATCRLANFCAGGELSRYDMEARLLRAAMSAKMPSIEAERTIVSGFNIGWKHPKQVPPAKVNS